MTRMTSAPAAAGARHGAGTQTSSQMISPSLSPPRSTTVAASPGVEVTLLVEHGVVRQRHFAVIREHLAVAHESRAVVDGVALILGIADVRGDAADLVANQSERSLYAAAQAAMQQEILGRIAAERELREQHELAPHGTGALGVVENFAGVRVDCTDARVDLGEPDLHPSALAIASPRSASERTVRTPAFSSAANFSFAVPLPPEMIAPAWPMRLPAGAVTPAI